MTFPEPGPKYEEFVPSAFAGERLDRFVALVTGLSRAAAAELVTLGGVVIDDVPASSGKVRLSEGRRVTIDTALLPVAGPPSPDASIDFGVLHEDPDVIIVDKPAGLVVHPGSGNPDGTLVNGLLARYPELADVGDPHRPGVVHRLDAGTSGALVVARTSLAYELLVAALARRDVHRGYVALVWGHPEQPNGIIDAPIGRDPRDPLRMAVVADGRSARTRYRVARTFTSPTRLALVECELETGRTHQIRVHLAAIGHPVVGDVAYGGDRPSLSMPRPFLHARTLRFVHPRTGDTVSAESAMPSDLEAVLRQLS
jgi:23S rRNA pseudouridine1911/1915/1917 synthase